MKFDSFKILVSLIVFFLPTYCSFGQFVKVDSISNWRKSLKAGLNLNQASFSDNWKAGGVNSIGFTAFLNYKANFKKDKKSWDNEFDFLYGMVNNTGQGYRKTLDRIFIDTKYGSSLNEKWDVFLSANLQSQFDKGYKYGTDAAGLTTQTLISSAFSPTFITAALGFEYHPVSYFKLRLSPFAFTFTSTSGLNVGDKVSGTGIATGAKVAAIDGTSVTVTIANTAAVTATTAITITPVTKVFNTYFAGQQALAEAVAEEPHVVIGPVVDKLMRHRPLGWYGVLGQAIYRQEALYRVETSSSIDFV